MKKLSRIFAGFIYFLPAVLCFSYFPVISLGFNETMNFELSLPLLWLVSFDFFAAGILIKLKLWQKLFCKENLKWILFPVFLTISCFWSLNMLRGILTVGILWLIYFAVFAFLKIKPEIVKDRDFRKKFLKNLFAAGIFMAGVLVLQCVLDLLGVLRDYSLMCAGCVSGMFGFPHPNGFAIEPQFMGNLLLAPAIILGAVLITACPSDTLRAALAKSSCSLGHIVIKTTPVFFAIVVSAIFLTFSRGAIYAFGVGMIVLSFFAIRRGVGKKVIKIWGVIVVAFLFSLNLQGIFAQIGPTNDTYYTGVAKVLNHLSLGVIEIRGEGVEDAGAVTEDVVMEGETTEGDSAEAVFSGYVAESTETRTRLSGAAAKIWASDFRTMAFGVGLGGAGTALYLNGESPAPKEIVQNQYMSLLLETGAVGVLLFIYTICLIFGALRKNVTNEGVVALIISYMISVLFFAGLPNALHIYLLPGLLISEKT